MNRYLVTLPLDFGKPVNPAHILSVWPTLKEAQTDHAARCNAANDTHAAWIRGPYTDQTEEEAHEMIKAGMTMLTPAELATELNRLGYRISGSNSFNYFNTGNARHYKARSISIVEADTSQSFAHVDSRRDENFKALQAIRYSSFAYHNGRIWEL